MKVDNQRSSIEFIRPFLFEADEFTDRVAAIESAQWRGSDWTSLVWERHDFPKDDLLPHVGLYLNPPDHATHPTARLWHLVTEALRSRYGLGGGARNPYADWRLLLPHRDVPFYLESARLMLFRVGVGFLSVVAKPPAGDVSDWLDFLHYFRFVRGQRDVRIKLQRRTGKDQYSPFFPDPAGGISRHPDGVGFFEDVIDCLIDPGRAGETGGFRWGDIFIPGQLLPFCAFFINDATEGEIAEAIYRVRNFFHARQEIHATQDDLCFRHPALLAYAKQQWFTFSLDGGAFLAFDTPATEFFCSTLPNHLFNQYFLLYILSLHQRFALMMLSGEVADHCPMGAKEDQEEQCHIAFERIHHTLLSFTARGLFTQVMQQEHHHRCYQKWQEVLQIKSLYEEVSNEVRAIYDYLQAHRIDRLRQLGEIQRKQTERFEKMLNLFMTLIGVPALVLSFLGATKQVSLPNALRISFLGVVAGSLLYVVLSYISRRKRGQDYKGKT